MNVWHIYLLLQGLPLEVEVFRMPWCNSLQTFQSSQACLWEIRRRVQGWHLKSEEREDLGPKNRSDRQHPSLCRWDHWIHHQNHCADRLLEHLREYKPVSEYRYRRCSDIVVKPSDIGTDVRANSDIGTKSDIGVTSDIVVKIYDIGSDIVGKTPISGTRYRIPGSCHLRYRVLTSDIGVKTPISGPILRPTRFLPPTISGTSRMS